MQCSQWWGREGKERTDGRSTLLVSSWVKQLARHRPRETNRSTRPSTLIASDDRKASVILSQSPIPSVFFCFLFLFLFPSFYFALQQLISNQPEKSNPLVFRAKHVLSHLVNFTLNGAHSSPTWNGCRSPNRRRLNWFANYSIDKSRSRSTLNRL